MTAQARARVVVVGSNNLDLLAFVERLPTAGETIEASELRTLAGGKGANQAVGAARFGAEVSMVGMVGDDAAAAVLRSALTEGGVGVEFVGSVAGNSGQALISVAPDDVTIVVVAGANAALGAQHVEAARDEIASAQVLLLQGEVGVEPAERAARIAARHGTLVVFNPAPFNDVAHVVAPLADVLIVNESEARQLDDAAIETSATLLAKLTTLGAAGCRIEVSAGVEPLTEQQTAWLARHGGHVRDDSEGASITVPAPAVAVVDTTGAGDAFCGAVGALLGEALRSAERLTTGDVVRAAVMGVRAGALAVTSAGAQAAMADRSAVEALLGSERSLD